MARFPVVGVEPVDKVVAASDQLHDRIPVAVVVGIEEAPHAKTAQLGRCGLPAFGLVGRRLAMLRLVFRRHVNGLALSQRGGFEDELGGVHGGG